MHCKITVVVFVLVAVATERIAAVKFAVRASTESPLQITSPKTPYNLSVYVRSQRTLNKDGLQNGNDNGKLKSEIGKHVDNLDVSATHLFPIHAWTSHHNFFPMFFGFNPFFLNSQGYLMPESHLHPSVSGTGFPYFWSMLGCPLECEHHQQNTFPFFHHGSGAVQDLAEPPLAYATPGRHAPDHRDNGANLKFPSDSNDVDHTKTPPHLLHTRINNGQYTPQRLPNYQ